MNVQIAPDLTGTLTNYAFGQLFDLDNSDQLFPSGVVLEFVQNDGLRFTSDNTATVDSSTGIVSYIWSSTESDRLQALGLPSQNHRAEWTFTVPGGTIERVQFFDVAIAPLITRITDTDVVNEVSVLAGVRERVSGNVTSGTTTTVVDTQNLLRFESGRFDGSQIHVNGEWKRVLTFDGETGTLTLASPLDSAASRDYRLEMSYNYAISAAFLKIQRLLSQKFDGLYGQLIDGIDIQEAHLHKACELACRDRATDNPMLYDALANEQGKRFTEAMTMLEAKVSKSVSDAEGKGLVGGTLTFTTSWTK